MEKLKINLVNYEQGMGINGILTKYAKQMQRALIDLGHNCTISHLSDPEAKINHHINYYAYKPSGTKDTTMITHITGDMYTEREKVNKIKESLETSVGICFDQRMKDLLINNGCPKEKLEVVLPAHDSLPRRPRIIAVATNLYPDGRKREGMFIKLIQSIKDQKNFTFRILGKGWGKTLNEITKNKNKIGFQVQWKEDFLGDFYQELLSTSDYLLYTGGENCLAQSIIDAKNAGLRIIAPPQEDIEIEYPFTNQKELNDIFAQMEENPVEGWTWENYCKSHLKIWKQMI